MHYTCRTERSRKQETGDSVQNPGTALQTQTSGRTRLGNNTHGARTLCKTPLITSIQSNLSLLAAHLVLVSPSPAQPSLSSRALPGTMVLQSSSGIALSSRVRLSLLTMNNLSRYYHSLSLGATGTSDPACRPIQTTRPPIRPWKLHPRSKGSPTFKAVSALATVCACLYIKTR